MRGNPDCVGLHNSSPYTHVTGGNELLLDELLDDDDDELLLDELLDDDDDELLLDELLDDDDDELLLDELLLTGPSGRVTRRSVAMITAGPQIVSTSTVTGSEC